MPREADAAYACAMTSAIFVATYWLANHFTSLRHDVGATVFDWERHIPFVPWTIVPYLSICVFFVLSFFAEGGPIELRRHVARLMLVLLVAMLCYAAFPLRFTFERPVVDGLFHPMYAALVWFDRPYNRAPSLHIAVLLVLWARFSPCRGQWAGRCLHLWFGLIAVSVLTTYQHHVIDVLAGWLLGAGVVAVTALPDGGRPRRARQ
ncbi:hypothetical protein RD110_00030 [Rhodoferax koreense]|uniref:Uncharacterized protein n=1 Tax=Rhodoferax koreensis TaxID=1842727 RepID=A0A1P8JPY6_9BURK|nr:hypothetical protein RD110_00030 [Rhodoferax koreense]